MRKVTIVFGTRPEVIKMAPIAEALRRSGKELSVEVCATGQHADLVTPMLKWFDINPTAHLNVMTPGQDLSQLSARLLTAASEYFSISRPDLVLVHGDTSTASAAAVAAFYSNIPVGHVEAGLRTHSVAAPFPEEFNRRVISIVADMHFAPTELARTNLIAESVPETSIFVTGNTVVDALIWTYHKLLASPDKVRRTLVNLERELRFNLESETFILVTEHRRESFGDGLAAICNALRDLARAYPSVRFVFPVHLNPKVLQPVKSRLSGIQNIHLMSPVSYETFVYLLSKCYLVLTDSGGLQEEAPTFGKPVLVMRRETERSEALIAGTALLVGQGREEIFERTARLLEDKVLYSSMSTATNPFGDGKAAERIVEVIANFWEGGRG